MHPESNFDVAILAEVNDLKAKVVALEVEVSDLKSKGFKAPVSSVSTSKTK